MFDAKTDVSARLGRRAVWTNSAGRPARRASVSLRFWRSRNRLGTRTFRHHQCHCATSLLPGHARPGRRPDQPRPL